MSETKEVPCDVCNGSGEIEVWEYSARDVQIGTNEVPEHTMMAKVPCRSCLGSGHVREDKAV